MDSTTLTLSGNSSVLEAQYFPPIELDSNKNYVLGLVELLTCNSFPNIDTHNKFIISGAKKAAVISMPTGSYEIDDIESYLRTQLHKIGVTLSLKPNNNTLHCEILCSENIDFTDDSTIGRILGFSPRKLEANKLHRSDAPIQILKIN